MQRTFLCASAFSAIALLISPAGSHAGEKQGLGRGHHEPPSPHQPPPKRVISGSPTAAQPVTPTPTPVLTPTAQANPVILPATLVTSGVQNVTVVQGVDRALRPVQPLSFHLANPNSVVAKLPSGRVVVATALGFYVPSPERLAYQNAMRRPYAPPTFQVIGNAPTRHMGRPVRLTYGTSLPEGYNPGPKVIWLDRKGGPKAHAHEAEPYDPHVRYMK